MVLGSRSRDMYIKHVCDILIDQNVTNHVCDIFIDQPKRGLAPRWRVLELFCNVLPVRLARGEFA